MENSKRLLGHLELGCRHTHTHTHTHTYTCIHVCNKPGGEGEGRREDFSRQEKRKGTERWSLPWQPQKGMGAEANSTVRVLGFG